MLVTYRMMGLTLFLHWLERSSWLPQSRTLLPFMTSSMTELSSFQETWAQERKKDLSLKSRAVSFRLRFISSKTTLKPALRSAQQYAAEMDRESQCLRGFLEKLWDRLDGGTEGCSEKREEGGDPILLALDVAAREAGLAGGRLSVTNRLQLMQGIAKTRFLCGLCEAITETLAEVESLLKLCDQSVGTEDHAQVCKAIETAEGVFLRDFALFHGSKAALLKDILQNGAQIPCTVDIVTYSWKLLETAVENLPQQL